MRTAFCAQDNVIYTVEDFHLVEGFSTKRRFLLCTECRGDGFYRRPSRNGREACFGAWHETGCTLAAVDRNGGQTGEGEIEDEILTIGQRIVVDFNVGTIQGGGADEEGEIPVTRGTAGGGNGLGPALREEMHRRLRSILRSLIGSEEFRNQDQIIEVAGNEYTISEFFVNIADAAEEHLDELHGFWGMIPNTQTDDNGTLWFNSQGGTNVSAFLDRRYIQEAMTRFGWGEEEDLAGAYLLIFGILKRSRSGKLCIEISALERFTVRLAR